MARDAASRDRAASSMSAEPGSKPAAPIVLVSDRQGAPLDLDGLAGLAASVLAGEGRRNVELSLSFVTPEEMEDLHVRYVGEPGATDVLSFPLGEHGLLGDVVVCPAVAGASVTAGEGSADLQSELRLLVVHGVLHLLGHDHQRKGERARMWALQELYSGVRLT